MLEQLFSADAWKNIETFSKWAGPVLGAVGVCLVFVSLAANRNASLRSVEPRTLGQKAASKSNEPAMSRPLPILVVAHGGAEAHNFAKQIYDALPSGSNKDWWSINAPIDIKSSTTGLAYQANGHDPGPLIAWLEAKGLSAIPTQNAPVAGSVRLRNADKVYLIVGPRKTY